MSEYSVAIIAILSIFALPVLTVGFILFKLIDRNSRERLELARHGIVPPVRSKPSPNKYRALRNGILCLGLAAGIVAGVVIVNHTTTPIEVDYEMTENIEIYLEAAQYEFFTFCASIITGLGLAYLVFFLIVKDKNLDGEQE